MSHINKVYKFHELVRDRFAGSRVRFVILTIYYLGILVTLVALYGQGDFSTPPFIYQNF
jgi:hypothetical protein